jgi:hypothetical protein
VFKPRPRYQYFQWFMVIRLGGRFASCDAVVTRISDSSLFPHLNDLSLLKHRGRHSLAFPAFRHPDVAASRPDVGMAHQVGDLEGVVPRFARTRAESRAQMLPLQAFDFRIWDERAETELIEQAIGSENPSDAAKAMVKKSLAHSGGWRAAGDLMGDALKHSMEAASQNH